MDKKPRVIEKWDEDEYTYLKHKNPHKRDGEILFHEDSHSYGICTKDGKIIRDEVICVSDWIKQFTKPFNPVIAIQSAKSVNRRFQYWYEHRHQYPDPRACVEEFKYKPIWPEHYERFVPYRVFEAILFREAEGGKRMRMTEEDVRWKTNWKHPLPAPLGTFTAEDVKNGWSRRGSEMHKYIEQHLNRIPNTVPSYRDKEWTAIMEFLKWCDEVADLEFIRTEMRIGIPEIRVCGSFDALARRRSDGAIILIDWKNTDKLHEHEEHDKDAYETTRMKFPFDHLFDTTRNGYYIQQNLYKIFLQRRYGYTLDEMWLAVIPPSKSRVTRIVVPDFIKDCPRTRRAFNCVLNERHELIQKKKKQQEEGEELSIPPSLPVDAAHPPPLPPLLQQEER